MNKRYFNRIDCEKKAYWLGFLLADGNISKTTNRICFTLKSSDSYILKDLKKEIECGNSIRNYLVYDKRTDKFNKCSVFQFSSKEFKNDLSSIGVGADKSLNFDFTFISKNKYFNHFLRGLFDGDGYIAKDKSVVMIISTKEFLEFLNESFFYKKLRIDNITKNVNRMYIQNHATCLDFLDYIYAGATIFLKRKYKKYLSLKKKNIFDAFRTRQLIAKHENGDIEKFISIKDFCLKYKTDPGTIINLIKKNKKYKGIELTRGRFTIRKKRHLGQNNFKTIQI